MLDLRQVSDFSPGLTAKVLTAKVLTTKVLITKVYGFPMAAISASDLRTVRRFTSAGISDCKAALERHRGDTYLAIRDLLTADQILEMQRSLRIRNIAPKTMKDPPTHYEIRLVERLYRDVVLDKPLDQPWWRRWLVKLVGDAESKNLAVQQNRESGETRSCE